MEKGIEHMGRQKFWQRLRNALRELNPPRQSLEFNADLIDALHDLAARDRRSLPDVAADLIAAGLALRSAEDIYWQCWQSLTPREQDVVALICQGLTNLQIADQLVISSETVKTHVHNVLIKFGLNTRSELRQILAGWDFSGFQIPREEG